VYCSGVCYNIDTNGVKVRKIKKPWGYEVVWADTDSYVGKLLHINAGNRLSLQYHRTKEETVYILSGVLYNYDADGKITKFLPGQVYHVKPGTVHRFGANESHVELMEVSTNHLDDVVRLADDYKR
jgi:mannose-6-phosphate isomerase-like protein (cupin superfamily)